ncbi:MAG: radical SAM protein [Candidatus Latescibacteria bacterium]|nr:radical SAM protein [Candidatus Latescibacterota bacterium]
MKSVHIAARSLKNISNVLRGIPAVILANLLLTRRCTQNCLQCTIPQDSGDTPFMEMANFTRLVDMFDRHGTQFVSLSGGEPILHQHIDECIRYATQKQFVHVQLLSTLYASKPVVEKVVDVLLETGAGIQVSFDGFGEVADTLRGATNVSDTVQWGMELITRKNKQRRKPVRTSANIVLSKLNLHQTDRILNYIECLGWKCNVDLYRWTSENTNEVQDLKIEDNREFKDALDRIIGSPAVTTPTFIIEHFTDYLKGDVPKRCPYLDSRGLGTKIYVNPECSVSVCIGKPFGNLLEQSPVEFFRSKEWSDRIKMMRACKGCWNSCYTPSGIVFHPGSISDLKAIWEIVRKG